jgi:hypothetical protein
MIGEFTLQTQGTSYSYEHTGVPDNRPIILIADFHLRISDQFHLMENSGKYTLLNFE